MLDAAGLLDHKRIFFGGTPPVAAVAREFGYFTAIFSGEESPRRFAPRLRSQADAA